MKSPAMERLAEANPVSVSSRGSIAVQLQLDEIKPRARPSWWSRQRRTALALGALGVLAAAALLVAPALGLGIPGIDFFGAEKASPKIVKGFASLSEGAPPGMDPQVISGETRRVTTVTSSGVAHTLWVAPTRDGGLCFEWWPGSGGCDRKGDIPLAVTWSAPRTATSPASAQDFGVVDGHAHAPWVDGVEIRLSDGQTVRPEVTWISAPINAGFFLYEAPKGLSIRAVIGTKNGEAVDADSLGSGDRAPGFEFADLSKREVVETKDTSAGRATVWQAPTKTDKVCTWLEFGGTRNFERCLPPEEIEGIGAGAVNARSTQVVWAAVGPTYGELIFRFDDGTSDVERPHAGMVLHAAPVDARGTLLARRRDGSIDPSFSVPLPMPTASTR
jgi:hypothetical protein